MKYTKVIISIIVILFICLIFLYKFNLFFEQREDIIHDADAEFWSEQFYDFDSNRLKMINNCKQEVCDIDQDEYRFLSVNNSSLHPYFNEIFNRINSKTTENYIEAEESNMDSSECDSVRDKYNHSIRYTVNFENYSDDKYISVVVQRRKINVCLKTIEYLPLEVNIYDTELEKFLSREEFRESLKIDSNELINLMKNEFNKDNIDINEIILFYNMHGDLIACIYDEQNKIINSIIVR